MCIYKTDPEDQQILLIENTTEAYSLRHDPLQVIR